ncbi:MAG: hypothetical protein ACLTJ5_07480 [Clostridium sp.]
MVTGLVLQMRMKIAPASLSLAGYEGGDLYLVVQNMQASVGYIEVKSITLKSW